MSSTSKSPTKRPSTVKSSKKPVAPILTENSVEHAHEASVSYIVAQHKDLVVSLQRDNEMLRTEN